MSYSYDYEKRRQDIEKRARSLSRISPFIGRIGGFHNGKIGRWSVGRERYPGNGMLARIYDFIDGYQKHNDNDPTEYLLRQLDGTLPPRPQDFVKAIFLFGTAMDSPFINAELVLTATANTPSAYGPLMRLAGRVAARQRWRAGAGCVVRLGTARCRNFFVPVLQVTHWVDEAGDRLPEIACPKSPDRKRTAS